MLNLYNALNGTHYTKEENLIINTLEDAIYIGMKNDLSFLIRDSINFYEHQSTFNPNMAVRGLFYLADVLQEFIETEGLDVYGSKRIKLLFPRYLVFYNGTDEQPDRMEMCLSDAFEPRKADEKPAVECRAIMLNINLGHNRELMEKCRRLQDYAVFTAGVRRRQARGEPLRQAVDETVNECIRNGILEDILRKNRAEVMDVVLTEYNEERHIKNEKDISCEEGKTVGRTEGKAEALLFLLEDLEEIPELLRHRITEETDTEKLNKWLLCAKKAGSIREFQEISGIE